MRKKKVGGKRVKHMGSAVFRPELAVMPMGAEAVIGGKRMRHMGGGFFGDLWSGIKKGVSSVLPMVGNLANEALKGSKLISTGLSAIPLVGGVASNLASRAGYGRRRRKRGGASLAIKE